MALATPPLSSRSSNNQPKFGRISTLTRSPAYSAVLVVLVGLMASFALGSAAAQGAQTLRITTFAASIVLLGALILFAPAATTVVALLALIPLGLIRRVIAVEYGSVADDPLLLIGPVVVATVGVLALITSTSWPIKFGKNIALTVGILQLLLLVSTFNPQIESPLNLRLASLLFLLIPSMGFWIGRKLLDENKLRATMVAVAVIGVVAVIYGLWQVYFGFPNWDQSWIDRVYEDYLALNVRGTIRPFSFFSSYEEYSVFAGCALVVCASAIATRPARSIWLAPIAILLSVGVLTVGNRASFLTTLLAIAAIVAARNKLLPATATVLGAGALTLIFVVAPRVDPSFLGSQASNLVEHQLSGIASPLDADESTAGIHTNLQITAISRAFSEPFGSGATANKLSDRSNIETRATERDLGDIATTSGLPGLFAYLFLVVVVMFGTYRLAVSKRDFISLSSLGVLVVTFQQWFDGGLYFVAPFTWLIIGVMSRHFHPASKSRSLELPLAN